jgi:hypothetical protein
MRSYPLNISTWLLIGLLVAGFRPALISWVTVNEQSGRLTFSFPAGYNRYTTDEVVYYSATADNLTYSFHYADATNTASLGLIRSGQTTQNAPPALDQFVTYLAQSTGGQVISQQAVYQSDRQGRDVEVNFTEPEGDQTLKMFVRVFIDGNRVYVFTLVAPTARANDLSAARSILFNSISFY